ncbi:sigma-54-dependent Fis family transcriptional regulator [Aneurinibacillus thermoaerophilus]|uniref:Sigma-54-dependent Fis family transcriptional regulator n=1 Tax=Aneurinibacillus thermoaerophilus TaxID=143495 RepID=A0ABX8Y949_ANETH|nr:sigma-54-dependent Fis family transcriptional regulator [Aneurinibacillus thermoaerophilus]QYY42164.1 sigma-54-dependent Fis family transcriptional regulator [Aneurinibacillus thermoaerophilus]
MVDGAMSKRLWKQFIQEGVLDSSRINKRIIESWYRCQHSGVNPHSGEGREILTGKSFLQKKEENSVLLDIALPYLDKLNQHMKGSRSTVLLIDLQGYVLVMKGDAEILGRARKINFVEGVKWTEDEVGTNAIGTALRTGEPINVKGAEHYSIASHVWTCSAAPVRDDQGNLVGVLNVSSPVQHYHPHTLATVVSTAYAIEHQWSLREQQDQLELMQRSIDLLQTNQLMAIFNRRKQMVCVNQAFQSAVPEWSNLNLADLREYGYRERLCTPLYSARHSQLIGYCIQFEAPSKSTSSKKFYTRSLHFPGETGISKVFQQTLREIELVAHSDADIYIHGETGTGKEVIARAIHQNSSRKNGPFITVNCGAIPPSLMESELFGYVRGAFTGARRHGHKGKLEQANHGTLFLDEIGEIPPAMQVALLRVLQEREVIPLGGMKAIPLDIRVITATHHDLRELVQQGNFREDLFYRLFVFPINVPSLRERKEDIPYLVKYYCRQKNWPVEIPDEIMNKFIQYDWPGNIRELFNALERMRIFCGDESPDLSHLPPLFASTDLSSPGEQSNSIGGSNTLTLREQIQKEKIIQALQKTGGNATQAARLMNIPRSTFYRRLQKFNL